MRPRIYRSRRTVSSEKGVFFIYQQNKRAVVLFVILIFFGLFLAGRLFSLQILEYEKWTVKAVSQRRHGATLKKSRGLICDRHGKKLTNPGQKRYGAAPLANHVLGYLDPTEGRGMAGVEYRYEELLRGDVNLTRFVDSHSQPFFGLIRRNQAIGREMKGLTLLLTLDRGIQEAVERFLDKEGIEEGAVIISHVQSGQILAMASRPLFDPNNSPGACLKAGSIISLDPKPSLTPKPSLAPRSGIDPMTRGGSLQNRALAPYRPGSVFNVLIAAAALEGGIVLPETIFDDPGRGPVSFTQAMAYSSDPVFLQVGLKTGVESVLNLVMAYGIGQPGVLGLKEEATGFIPKSAEVSEEELVEVFRGEKNLAVTPLQVCGILQSIANNGLYYPPSIAYGCIEEWERRIRRFSRPSPQYILSTDTALLVRRMLEGVVAYGTGRSAAIHRGIAGINSTVRGGSKNRKGEEICHGWFAGYAPAHDPVLVGVIFLEDDPGGGEKAAKLFGKLMTALLPGPI